MSVPELVRVVLKSLRLERQAPGTSTVNSDDVAEGFDMNDVKSGE
jgi:hypothetical protein